MKTIAFIPARGGSKSIPGKNIKPLSGRPLIHWVLMAAKATREISQVYLSTDAEDIANCAYEVPGVEVVKRSPQSSTDMAATELAILEFIQTVSDFDALVMLQPTSPLIEPIHITTGINRLREGFDSAIGVVEQKRFLWYGNPATPINYDPKRRPMRQFFQGHFVENGALYATTKSALLSSKCRISGRISPVLMPSYTYYELDEPRDWEMVEFFIEKMGKVNGGKGLNRSADKM